MNTFPRLADAMVPTQPPAPCTLCSHSEAEGAGAKRYAQCEYAPFSCRCHGPHPPPGPVYALRRTKKQKKVQEQEKSPEGSPCLPCVHPVTVRCLGGHSHKQVACCAAGPYECGQPCGNALSCGNHTCAKPCHAVMTSEPDGKDSERDEKHNGISVASDQAELGSEASDGSLRSVQAKGVYANDKQTAKLYGALETTRRPSAEPCEQCVRKCTKPRAPPCTHPCPLTCHPGPCPPCTSIVRRKCHCEAGVSLAIECRLLAAAEAGGEEARDQLLSCGNKCDRKLPLCGHTCQEVCHGGACPNPEQCRKKVGALNPNVCCNCLGTGFPRSFWKIWS